MDFINGPATRVALAPADWSVSKVAYTSGGSRKFLFPPALLNNGTINYLAIGSGDREHPLEGNYPFQDGVVNRVYVFKDNLQDTDASTVLNLDNETSMYKYKTSTACDSAQMLTTSVKTGWSRNL